MTDTMTRAAVEAMIRRPENCGLIVEVEPVVNRDECRVTLTVGEPLYVTRESVMIAGNTTEAEAVVQLREAANQLSDKMRAAANTQAYRIESAWTTEALETRVSRYCVMCGTPRKVATGTTAFLCANPECRHTVVVR